MAQKVLSLDIRQDVITGLMVDPTTTGATVQKCSSVACEGKSFAEAVEEVMLHLGYVDEPCRVSYSAEHFFFRNLQFPFSDKRKIDKILALELAETLPMDISSLELDSLVNKNESGASVVAALLDSDFLARELEHLASVGLDPDIVTISSVQTALQIGAKSPGQRVVLLDLGCRRMTIFVVDRGQLSLVRPVVFDDGSGANFILDRHSLFVAPRRPELVEMTVNALCREVNHTLYTMPDSGEGTAVFVAGPLAGAQGMVTLLEQGLGVEVSAANLVGSSVDTAAECGAWNNDLMTAALALGMRGGKRQQGMNFRKGRFVKKNSFARYRRLVPQLGIPLAVCLAVGVGYLWNEHHMRAKELEQLKIQARQVFLATLPEVGRVVDPVKQLGVEIRELKNSMEGAGSGQTGLKILDLLAEISVRVPKRINVHLMRLVADRDSVLLRGLTDNFNSVDGIKQVLESSPYFAAVTITSANVENKSSSIRFELRLQLNEG